MREHIVWPPLGQSPLLRSHFQKDFEGGGFLAGVFEGQGKRAPGLRGIAQRQLGGRPREVVAAAAEDLLCHAHRLRRSLLGLVDASLIAAQPSQLLPGEDLHARALGVRYRLRHGQGSLQRSLALDAGEPGQHQRVPGILRLELGQALVVGACQRTERPERSAHEPEISVSAAATGTQSLVQRGGQLAEAGGQTQTGGTARRGIGEVRIGTSGVAVALQFAEHSAHAPRFVRPACRGDQSLDRRGLLPQDVLADRRGFGAADGAQERDARRRRFDAFGERRPRGVGQRAQ